MKSLTQHTEEKKKERYFIKQNTSLKTGQKQEACEALGVCRFNAGEK